MSVRTGEKSTLVARCVARQDGGFMLVAANGQSAVALSAVEIGTRVVIRDGKAYRPKGYA